jgi:hypothetical protein
MLFDNVSLPRRGMEKKNSPWSEREKDKKIN